MIVACTLNLLMDHPNICCYMLIVAKSKKYITNLKAHLSNEF
jgi:hypothetical protein